MYYFAVTFLIFFIFLLHIALTVVRNLASYKSCGWEVEKSKQAAAFAISTFFQMSHSRPLLTTREHSGYVMNHSTLYVFFHIRTCSILTSQLQLLYKECFLCSPAQCLLTLYICVMWRRKIKSLKNSLGNFWILHNQEDWVGWLTKWFRHK